MDFRYRQDTRHRSANFSKAEEKLLVKLVKKYQENLECKKSDTTTNRIKAMTWQQVASEFNKNTKNGEVYRDRKILKNKYENLKKRCKQKYLKIASHSQGNANHNLPERFRLTSTDEEIYNILGVELTDGMKEIGYAAKEDCNLKEERSVDGSSDVETAAINETVLDEWQDHSITDPLEIVKSMSDLGHNGIPTEEVHFNGESSETVYRPKRRKLKFTTMTMARLDFENTMKRLLVEEHTLKLNLMQEKHNMEMEMQIKEHNLRMEILKLEKEKLIQKYTAVL